MNESLKVICIYLLGLLSDDKVQTKREQEIMMELKDMDAERRLQEGAENSKKKPGLDDAFDGRNWESMDTEDKSTPFD